MDFISFVLLLKAKVESRENLMLINVDTETRVKLRKQKWGVPLIMFLEWIYVCPSYITCQSDSDISDGVPSF